MAKGVPGQVNDLFAGEDFTPAAQQSWTEGIATVLMDDRRRIRAETIRAFGRLVYENLKADVS